MVAQPESVPAVRRFVDDALTTWGRADLIDDVSLSVTELATNATLHSRSNFFDVELPLGPRRRPGGGRRHRRHVRGVDRAAGRPGPHPDEPTTSTWTWSR